MYPIFGLSSIFTFIIILVIVNNIFKILKIKASKQADKKDDNHVDYDLRLKKLEDRIANLETIVLERERDKRFSSL